MKFQILRDPKTIAERRAELQQAYRAAVAERGQMVRYEMPAMPHAFQRLSRALDGSEHRKLYFGIYYYIETKDRRLRQLVPASEYYKSIFRAVADKLYSLRVGFRRVGELEACILRSYSETRWVVPTTGQPSVRFAEEVYALKAEVAGALFIARGIPDTIATLFHFLYGPSSSQFSSFADFRRYLRNTASKGKPVDEEMLRFIQTSMGWFDVIRDYRDYVTHVSSIDVSLFEDHGGAPQIVLENQIRPKELVGSALFGIQEFCEFADDLFASRIGAATSNGAA